MLEGVRLGAVGTGLDSETRLSWEDGQEKVFVGTVFGDAEMELTVSPLDLSSGNTCLHSWVA